MIKINIKTIPHSDQRYPTCGDYFDGEGVTEFRISQMENPDHEFLILIHELVEHYLIKKRGIKIEDIDDFDIEFEKNRVEGNIDEPGDESDAPYFMEHQHATDIEKALSKIIGVDWDNYTDSCNAL